MNKRQTSIQQSKQVRTGEGYPVKAHAAANSPAGELLLTIEMSKLPVPGRQLSCDAVSVRQDDFLVKLVFAQKEIFGAGYLSQLIIQMSIDSVLRFLETMEPLRAGVDALHALDFPVGVVSLIDARSEQCAVMSANIVLAGYSGTEGCLDFYYMSPFSVAQLPQIGEVGLDPVVRINLPSPLLFALWKELIGLKPSFDKATLTRR